MSTTETGPEAETSGREGSGVATAAIAVAGAVAGLGLSWILAVVALGVFVRFERATLFFALYFVPWSSPLIGGAVAGSLEGNSGTAGLRAGVLTGILLLLFVLGAGAYVLEYVIDLEHGSGSNGGGWIVPSLVLAAWYIGVGAISGALGSTLHGR